MQQLKMLSRERPMQCEARRDGRMCVKVEMPCDVLALGACLLKNWSKAEIFRFIIPFRDNPTPPPPTPLLLVCLFFR